MESKRNKAKSFLSEMKKSLSQVTFEQIVTALQSYKTSDSLEVLLSKMTVLTEDANTHGLFRGVSFGNCNRCYNLGLFRETEQEELRFRMNIPCTRSLLGPQNHFQGPKHTRPLTWALFLRYVPVCSPTSQETVSREVPAADWSRLWVWAWSLAPQEQDSGGNKCQQR